MMSVHRQVIDSPLGKLIAIDDDGRLRALLFERQWPAWSLEFPAVIDADSPLIAEARRQLDAYFAGDRRSFDLPFELNGTDFQKRVWTALLNIPYGETSTYARQAVAVGSPGAVRAVGQTNGRNPLCLILPCHRVVGTNGEMTGYAGGLEAKEFLLRLEGARLI